MSRDIAPLGLRMQPELKDKIEGAARAAGRSMNAEINDRLTKSFDTQPNVDAEQVEMYRKAADISGFMATMAARYVLAIIDELPEEHRKASAVIALAEPLARGLIERDSGAPMAIVNALGYGGDPEAVAVANEIEKLVRESPPDAKSINARQRSVAEAFVHGADASAPSKGRKPR